MPSLGPMELGIILFLVIIIFGVGKLPQVGGAVGKSLREFKKAQSSDEHEESPQKAVAASTAAAIQPQAENTAEVSAEEVAQLRRQLADMQEAVKRGDAAPAEEKS